MFKIIMFIIIMFKIIMFIIIMFKIIMFINNKVINYKYVVSYKASYDWYYIILD